MAVVKLTLSQRAGRFNTCQGNHQAWKRLFAALQAVVQLIRLETPLLADQAASQVGRIASGAHNRTTVVAEFSIEERLRPRFEATLSALANHATAETIAVLSPEDPRRASLTKINQAIAHGGYKLEIKLGDSVVTLENISKAPHARIDTPWAGEIILRATDWSTEQFMITGRARDIPHVAICFVNYRRRFNSLMRDQAPFVFVKGNGFLNQSGLRINRISTVERRDHDDLPEELRLHFAIGEVEAAL